MKKVFWRSTYSFNFLKLVANKHLRQLNKLLYDELVFDHNSTN
jgi:hypothetical protein